MRRAIGLVLLAAAVAAPSYARAQDPDDDGEGSGEVIVIDEQFPRGPRLSEDQPGSTVVRDDLERRLPRSSPDAIRYEPGVFVQQTAHSQGSAFIRGLTGQQTLLLFDGVRLNNSTYRQGPNQYFFTLDSQTLDTIQIVRGGGSTRHGSDALGGVIMAVPVYATIGGAGATGLTVDPLLRLRGATADGEYGARVQSHATWGEDWAVLAGAGGRRVGRLESGGVVRSPTTGEPPRVPRFAEDGRTQLGTGFDEVTADAQVRWRPRVDRDLKLAAYGYRQFDAPRTDQCPAPFAPPDECLEYDEQFRTLVYGAWDERTRWSGADRVRATVSWQRQRERRTLSRPSSSVENIGRDTVDTLGVSVAARTAERALAPGWRARLDYGVDAYHDRVASAAWIRFADIGTVVARSRGQYLDRSRYLTSGGFVHSEHTLPAALVARAGARLSWVRARAPGDPDSGSAAVRARWFPVAGNAGLEWRGLERVHLLAGVDRSFRAPNLDDLTSRQQTGPGFQFENPALGPERATTVEAGARLRGPVRAELWLFRTGLDGAVLKRPRDAADCPPNTPQCQSAWTRFQLVNADAGSEIYGAEVSLAGHLGSALGARASLAWTWGQGPNVGDPPSDPDAPFPARVPLSRIPPLNGTAEANWVGGFGLDAGAGLRWAARQSRLALADVSDERIPAGGTPGFVVVDVRARYRWRRTAVLSLVFENVFDAAYRYHGSSVNGPGRGLMLLCDLAPLSR